MRNTLVELAHGSAPSQLCLQSQIVDPRPENGSISFRSSNTIGGLVAGWKKALRSVNARDYSLDLIPMPMRRLSVQLDIGRSTQLFFEVWAGDLQMSLVRWPMSSSAKVVLVVAT